MLFVCSAEKTAECLPRERRKADARCRKLRLFHSTCVCCRWRGSKLQQQTEYTQRCEARACIKSGWCADAIPEGACHETGNGDANAKMWLAAAYEQGWFGKGNFPEALKWFRRSAEQSP